MLYHLHRTVCFSMLTLKHRSKKVIVILLVIWLYIFNSEFSKYEVALHLKGHQSRNQNMKRTLKATNKIYYFLLQDFELMCGVL